MAPMPKRETRPKATKGTGGSPEPASSVRASAPRKPATTTKPSKPPGRRTPATRASALQASPATAPDVVVGIVASAGGLDAFKRFFQAMPAQSGIAFVLVPHLHPLRPSLMPELIGRQTPMPVVEARDGVPLEANHVYVIAPNSSLALAQQCLQVTSPPASVGATPIDEFLCSLAADLQEKAIGIVLSGTGSHGTLGLKAIKAHGGVAIVQEPSTAEYRGMPESALAAGLADYVLPVADMPAALINYVRHLLGAPDAPQLVATEAATIASLQATLRSRSAFDFRAYRQPMLLRRVRRRMGLCQVDRLADYAKLLREHPEEVDRLCRDLLISVTSFFRDPEMFRVLEAELPALLRRRAPDSPLRVWVPGCATGEEAYSIAMLLLEALARAGGGGAVQVFASDLDASALATARKGVYADALLADIPLERARRFFARADDNHSQVTRELREAVVFAPHNLLADPPFSRLDLVSCRNLLIYLGPEAQARAVRMLRAALNPDGLLVLGPSEGVGRLTELFAPVSAKWRIFRRVAAAGERRALSPAAPGGATTAWTRGRADAATDTPLGELAQQMLLRDFGPAAVVVNARNEALHFSGPSELYLRQPTGAPTRDVLALVRNGLRARLRTALQTCLREKVPVSVTSGRVRRHGRDLAVRITVQPLPRAATREPLLLATFEDERPLRRAPVRHRAAAEATVDQLEYDLKSSREDLQGTIEELEHANEQLKTSHEEVMSMNEELQSANEELETSKEELQSLNEELSTVNNQLRDKVDELESSQSDLANLLTSADVATLFLGADRRIRRFTPAATRLFNLIAGDTGRPLGDITLRFADPALADDVAQVLATLTPRQAEVRTDDGHWYLRRVSPYRAADERVEGVVLSFSDIDPVKRAEEQLRSLNESLEHRVAERTRQLEEEARRREHAETDLRRERDFVATVLDTTTSLIVVIDRDSRIVRFNHACEEASGYIEKEVEGRVFWELGLVPDEEIAGVRAVGDGSLDGADVLGFENHWRHRDGSLRLFRWTNAPLRDAAGVVRYVVASAIDITERRAAEVREREQQEALAHMHRVHMAGELAALLAHEINQPLTAIASYSEAGLRGTASGARDGERQRSLFQRISEQALRAGRVIQDLRAFLAKRSATIAAFDVAETMRRARELAAPYARDHGVRIELELGGAPRALADAIQVEQIIVSLIRNAIESIDGAGMAPGRVTLRLAEREGSAEITVEDSGPGVHPDDVERLFEPFFTTKPEGMGMGLRISRTLAMANDGRLWAEPKAPGGAFHLTLPLAP